MAVSVRLKVDTDELTRGFEAVCQEEQNFKNRCESLESLTNDLASVWKGVDYDVFRNFIDGNMKSILEDMQEVLEGLENDIYWVRNDYESAYNEVAGALDGFYV